MTNRRQLHLGAFLAGTVSNMASGRRGNKSGLLLTRKAEATKLDFVFFGDGLYKSHPNFLNRFGPLTLLAALAMETSHIGLAATCLPPTATHSPSPGSLRQIDRISGGRAGWNIVTSVR